LQRHIEMAKKKIEENRQAILDLLLNKAALKQNIAHDVSEVFKQFKGLIKDEIESLKIHVEDPRIRLFCKDIGDFEKHVYVGSDVLIFHQHNNVFRMPDDNPLWGTQYFKEDDDRGFFGVIYIYNFLAQSFLQNRTHDHGYLIGRIFVNKDRHFMIEGKGQLGYMFRDVENMLLTEEAIKLIVQLSFVFAIQFDLLVPPYEFIAEMTVGEAQLISNNLQMQTGKRLGFKMKGEDNEFF
jgi:hypothetical protein